MFIIGLMIGLGAGYFIGLYYGRKDAQEAFQNLKLGDRLIRGHFSGLSKFAVKDAKKFLLKNEALGLVKAVNWWHGVYK